MQVLPTLPPYLLNIHFNSILPSTSSSYQWSLQVLEETFLCVTHLYACCMPYPPHSPSFYQLNITIRKTCNLRSSSLCNFLSVLEKNKYYLNPTQDFIYYEFIYLIYLYFLILLLTDTIASSHNTTIKQYYDSAWALPQHASQFPSSPVPVPVKPNTLQ